tara:strand:+ start:4457 stop:7954 length:3498 start_codon:yes stop_codon:yes gene_type:complete
MNRSLKNEYRNIFEFRELNPVNAQPSEFPDLIIINTTLRKILSEQISFKLKIHENKSNDIVVSKKDIVDAYFSFHTHISQNEEDLEKTITINEVSRSDSIKKFKDSVNPPEAKQALSHYVGSKYDITTERGGGSDLLISIVNASNPTEFINAITVFLYRKLVKKSTLEIKPGQDEIDELEIASAVNEVIDTFKSALQAGQAGLSTTFGPYFELLVYNAVRDKMISDRPEGDLKSIPPEIDSSDISLPSKKVSIILINILLKQQTNYMYNILINKTKTSDAWWESLFLYSLKLIDTSIIGTSVSALIDEYLSILNVSKSEYECFEYEKDEELYSAAADQNLYLPGGGSPFDFIIRQKNNPKEIKFGLFDLKCTNQYTTSDPIIAAKTGSNVKNSAIQNISNTVLALKYLAQITELRFLGLSSIEYSLDMSNEGRLYLNIKKAKNKISSPQSSLAHSRNRDEFILSDDGKSKAKKLHIPGSTSIQSEDYITDEIKAEYGKIKNSIKDFSFLCTKLSNLDYSGNFKVDIKLENYNKFLNTVLKHVAAYYKIKNDLTSCIAEINASDIIPEDKIDIINIISRIRNDSSYNLNEIISDCIHATMGLEDNYISNIIKSQVQLQQSRVKKNIAQSLLSVFKGRSKEQNLKSLESAANLEPSSAQDFYFSSMKKQNIKNILSAFKNKLSEISSIDLSKTTTEIQDHKRYTGKSLKEVYVHLFKKKLINEGGLAGHMMHPYEALDMTPRQIIDRIKEYSTSQSIIEKVDGQNLFFTVEQDGTLMFARNKADMTHNDLVEKFTNHPAEVPFVTGGNAIKKGVDQWLSSAGAFGQQEILDIFHPDGEARSFINFEIMHKDHPNQLEYGENFIVFHSIVDFVNGREAVYSSNNSQRLNKIINLMRQGIESSGYTLASNRTVDLNKLTNVQILSYIKRVKEIADQLEITDTDFLGDGVEKQIKKQLDAEGVDISDEATKILYGFALYGEDRSGNKIKSKDFTSLMKSEDVKKLRAINLTNANKAAAKVRRILSPFKEIFVDLGIDLLDGVPSAYMDRETDLANINRLRDKLETAIEDLRLYMSITPESNWDAEVNRLKEHYDKIEEVGIYNAVSTSVEGGVYDFEGDLLKVTGGFAPLNQILGAAYRDKKGIFPTFKEKFIQQESNRRSLKDVFSSVF